ncbi:Lrp/AsnC family transcriptional regulator [Nostocoides sp. HKS02]|uniref:Lrp/AsnC family transcriptional regulator n=1 Tax=Nostocoides sp. HKS02 TaxID=1813880 RepID=UPI0018A84F26|nr:Lrp/AsnC family transcriptional regulator [Tetrasphaera sp. HKS02]
MPDTDAVSTRALDPLSLRIVGALQVDGRASWRKIAEALGEPVRTVARRGAALLEDRTVQVVGLPNTDPTHIVRVRCRPGMVASVAERLAARPETVFVYAVGQGPEVVVEVMLDYADLAPFVLEDLPTLDGVEEVRTASALEYYRTVAEWSPGLLADQELRALGGTNLAPTGHQPGLHLDAVDRALVDALVADGRTPLQAVAALLDCSDATARRRIEQLTTRGVLRIRAVVEPALVGLPVETLVWIRVHPSRAPELGRALVASPLVRYCAFLAGDDQLLVDVTTADLDGLRTLLADHYWGAGADRVTATPLLRAYKRGGVLVPQD